MFVVRQATKADAEAIYAIETDSFSTPWSLESVIRELEEQKERIYFLVEEDGQAVAYAGAWMVYDEGQITNIAVRPDNRREGYGAIVTRKLIKELFNRGMTEIFLEVRISNIAALALYRRLGFTVKGVRKAYYTNPTEDAYIMSLVKEETL